MAVKRVLAFLTNRIGYDRVESRIYPIKDAFEVEGCFKDVPAEPGGYVMVAKTAKFLYPKGNSPVFYIGTSKNLHARLMQHNRLYKKAKGDFKSHKRWLYSRYNYAVKFKCDIYYMRIVGREKDKDLESKSIEGFYDQYGAIPVGNGAISYR